jgi:hypothetical protein
MKFLLNSYRNLSQKNEYTALLLFLVLIAKITSLLILYGSDFLYDDGWYYSSIARSVMEGKGFSNPFGGVDTGPTAWIPPFFVFFIIPVFKTIGDNIAGYFTLLTMQMAGFSLAFYFLLKAWDLTKISKNNLVIYIFFLYFLFTYQGSAFRMINDTWINILSFSLALYALVRFIQLSKSYKLLLFLAVFIPLASPTVALAFAIILSIVFISDFGQKFRINWITLFPVPQIFRFKHILLIGFIFALSFLSWGYYNYNTLNKFILTKSNAWYEFYLANVKDDDGILSESTVEKYHPDRNREECRIPLKTKGEVLWIKDFEDQSHEYLKTHRQAYYKKILNRVFNVFVWASIDNDNMLTTVAIDFPVAEKNILQVNELIHEDHWVCLEKDSLLVKSKLYALLPEKAGLLYQDWQQSFLSWQKAKYSIRGVISGFCAALLPLLCLLFIIITFGRKEKAFVLTISIVYVVYSIPYIMISHLARYQEPLLGLQSLILSITAIFILEKLSGLFLHSRMRKAG